MDRVVTLIGVGSVRVGPPLVAGVAAIRTDEPIQIRLFDANEERLDLFDRFARKCVETAESRHTVAATSDLQEALEEATHAILGFGGDCARRLLAPPPVPEDVPEPTDELVRGDMNKVTPVENLSPRTRAILAHPETRDMPRREAMAKAQELVWEAIPIHVRVLSLLRGVAPAESRRYTHLNWPAEPTDDERRAAPHRVLRWVQGEDTLRDYMKEQSESVARLWLEENL